MAAFMDCLMKAKGKGELTTDQATEIAKIYNSHESQYRLEMGFEDADRAAAKAVAERLKADAIETRRRAAITKLKSEEIMKNLKGHRNAKGELDFAEGVRNLIERMTKSTAKFSSVDGRANAILGGFHAELEQLLAEFTRHAFTGKTMGIERLENLVRELHGEKTGDVMAVEFSKRWRSVAEKARQRHHAAGGNIGKLEDWALPQMHDAVVIARAGREKWKSYIRPLLDRDKMVHPATGKKLNEAELDDSLDYNFETIITEGAAHRDPKLQVQGRSSLARRHADHRFLHFKNADSWLDYAKEFGGVGGASRDDVAFHAMMNYLRTMSQDIAGMEVLGPNPPMMMEWIKQQLQKEGSRYALGEKNNLPEGKTVEQVNDRISKVSDELDTLWLAWTGAMDTPVKTKLWGTDIYVSDIMATLRNSEVFSKLGSAVFSAMSDTSFNSQARLLAGASVLENTPVHVLGDVVGQLNKTSVREATQAGVVNENALHLLHRETRYSGSLAGPQWSRYIAERTLSLSGLIPWTQAGKRAFAQSFFGHMANNMHLNFEQLGKQKNAWGYDLRSTLESYGMTSRDWDLMRATRLHEPREGALFLRPTDVMKMDGGQRVGERYLEMVREMGRLATPEGTLRSTSMLKGNSRPGTLTGETMRSIAMFKSFPVAVMMLYGGVLQREMASGHKARGSAFIGATLLGTALVAGLGMQLAEISKGRDPRNMADMKFWLAAMAKGGGLGLFGDFLYADHNRYGGGWFQSLGGPVVGTLDKLSGLTVGNIVQAAQGKDTNFGKEAVDFIGGQTPVSSLWYFRAGWEHGILDQFQSVLDPDAHKAWDRKKKHYQKNFGQDSFYNPGEVLPSRAPDLSQAWK